MMIDVAIIQDSVCALRYLQIGPVGLQAIHAYCYSYIMVLPYCFFRLPNCPCWSCVAVRGSTWRRSKSSRRTLGVNSWRNWCPGTWSIRGLILTIRTARRNCCEDPVDVSGAGLSARTRSWLLRNCDSVLLISKLGKLELFMDLSQPVLYCVS